MNKVFEDKLHDIVFRSGASPFAKENDAVRQAVIEAHKESSITTVRINPGKKAELQFIETTAVPWCTDGLYLSQRPVFTADPLFHAGAYYVQDASSMFVDHVLKFLLQKEAWQNIPLRYLDLCAAPGGKSTLIASLLKDEDILISNEIIQGRAAILIENIVRWGQANTWVSSNDPKDFKQLEQFFDIMLIDAPCTGSGLWRKDADSIFEWSEQHVKLCSERQKRIISDALPALKNGGYLLYATCSYSPEENEQIADWLADNFEVENIVIPIENDWGIVVTESDKCKAAGYRFYPWKLKGEGFYLSVFRKKGESITEISFSKPPKSKPIPEAGTWKNYLNSNVAFHLGGEHYFAFTEGQLVIYNFLKDRLRIKKAGVRLGKIAKKDIIPEHELAQSLLLKAGIPNVETNLEEAISFLKKENNIMPDRNLKGWQLVNHGGLALGWGKWIPGRMNNYLPRSLKIRMEL